MFKQARYEEKEIVKAALGSYGISNAALWGARCVGESSMV